MKKQSWALRVTEQGAFKSSIRPLLNPLVLIQGSTKKRGSSDVQMFDDRKRPEIDGCKIEEIWKSEEND